VKKLVIVALATTLGMLDFTLHAQQPTFKAAVDMVPISAIVRDGRGRLVTTLRQNDFEVLDKGERRSILDFQTDDASPITMAVLVDASGSMRIGPKLAFAGEVVKHMTSGLRAGHDEIALFTFDAELHERQSFTSHPGALELSGTVPFGTTALYDAIAETARRLERRASQRRALVVITDGIDTSSQLSAPEVSALASSIDVPIYVVAAVPSIDVALPSARTQQESADLRELAIWTGGDMLWVTTGAEAFVRAQQILTELRHQYWLAIESSAHDEWRPIDVRVRNRRLTVRARTGYFSRGNQ
jgi:VWFA-related protein